MGGEIGEFSAQYDDDNLWALKMTVRIPGLGRAKKSPKSILRQLPIRR